MTAPTLTYERLRDALANLPQIKEHGDYLRCLNSLYEIHEPSTSPGRITVNELATLMRVHEYEWQAGLPETPVTFLGERRLSAMAHKVEETAPEGTDERHTG